MRTLNRKSEKDNQRPFDPFMSSAKVFEIEKKIKKLKDVLRPKLMMEVSRLAEMGDFSENVEYQLAKGKLRQINAQIMILENTLQNAEVIPVPKQIETIEIGHTVLVKVNGKKRTYKILGSSEVDLEKGIISHSSPIGKALIGCKVGDVINITPVQKRIKYEIIKIVC